VTARPDGGNPERAITGDCFDCLEADALTRVYAARDLLDCILWSEVAPLRGIDAAISGLANARNLFVAGGTASFDFPTTSGVYQTTFGGDVDGWIAQVSGDGSSILRSTFTGTPTFNQVYFLDLDMQENVYVYGQTTGSFPVTSGVYSNPNSGQFVQKFDNTLATLSFSTVFGSGIGIPNISPTAFIVNDCVNIFLSGWGGQINSQLGFWNSSTNHMPVTPDAYQKNTSGSDFYFMVLSSDASQLLYATYLGGADSRTHVDGGTCRFDKSAGRNAADSRARTGRRWL